MRALVDGDIIVYAVGFYNDITYYTVDGKGRHKYKKDAKIYAKKEGIRQDKIIKHHEANDMKLSLDGIDEMMKKIMSKVSANEAIPYLTGKDNFRETVAVTAPYKGNRKESSRPFWYNEMREYFVEAWDAVVVDGMEADDAMGIAQCRDSTEDTVICSIDKDLLMVPGNHYNWKKEEFTTTTEQDSMRFFYTQMLTGDSTDNIIGLKGIGPVRAKKLLAGCSSWGTYHHAVREEYNREFGSAAHARFIENTQLLWIKQEE